MAEVPPAREDHTRTGGLHGRHHLVVALRPAGLDDRGDASRERELGAVREGEERV